MITKLLKSDYKESLWKNGKGKTLQIAIFPPDAEVNKNNFLWRISSATISSPGPFSHFPGYKRQIIIWKGEGLKLNNVPLLPYSPITFSGETDVECVLLGTADVIDLGVIYQKDKITAQISVRKYSSDSTITLRPSLHFLFWAQGNECFLNNFKMDAGDSLKIENEHTLHLKCPQHTQATFFLVTLEATSIPFT